MSVAFEVVPMVSKSHCQNSRIAAVAGVLAAPDRPHVIALERRAELADVLGGEAGERHRQIEAQGDIAVAVILESGR